MSKQELLSKIFFRKFGQNIFFDDIFPVHIFYADGPFTVKQLTFDNEWIFGKNHPAPAEAAAEASGVERLTYGPSGVG